MEWRLPRSIVTNQKQTNTNINRHLRLSLFSRLDVKSSVQKQRLLHEPSLVQPPDEHVLSPLDAMQTELPQVERGQDKPEPPRHG